MKLDDPYLDELLSRLDQASKEHSAAEARLEQSASTTAGDATAAQPQTAAVGSTFEWKQEVIHNRSEYLQQQNKPPQVKSPSMGLPNAEPPSSDMRRETRFHYLPNGEIVPLALTSLAEGRLTESDVEGLILKFLLNSNTATGRAIAEQAGLTFCLIEKQLHRLKAEQMVVHKGSAPLGDYLYQLTPAGLEMARRYYRQCSYYGTTPVHFNEYIASVSAQSVTQQKPTIDDLRNIFDDLLINDDLRNQLGQAIYGGKGFFLYGAPGNGKTSIAERVTRAFGHTIWIPRAIGVDSEVIRLFDPCNHTEAPLEPGEGGVEPDEIDRRWVRIRRPTILVGGELTMDRLEIAVNKWTGINEAPLQLKSNCGTLVIDDFGRQRISTVELLNRWIVPLEKRFDFLSLPSGKTIQVPFDQLLVFSTNLEPKDLVDEAFLRRLPYKIEVFDATEREFRELFELYANRLGFEYRGEAVDYLIAHHYTAAGRRFRFCQPRDLLLQVRNYCQFNKLPLTMTPEAFDIAVRNYFAVIG